MELCRPNIVKIHHVKLCQMPIQQGLEWGSQQTTTGVLERKCLQLMTLTLNNQTKSGAKRRKEILKMRPEINKTSFDVPKPEIKINLVLWGYFLKSVPLGKHPGHHFRVGEMKAEVWTTSQRRGSTAAGSRKASILADY